MKNLKSHFYLLVICALFVSQAIAQETIEQKKTRIQSQELAVRDGIGLKYGHNTQTLTFAVTHMSDFVVKTSQNQQIKATIHTYWKEQNIYISSEYRQGQNMRVLIYQDNYRILSDFKFYVTYGFKFQGEKGKAYTIRFIDQGRISKLVAIEMSKSAVSLESRASKQNMSSFNQRISNMAHQLKALSGISQFAIVLHEKNSNQMNHNICIYMTYLIGQACVILLIVGMQIKFLLKMLKTESIV